MAGTGGTASCVPAVAVSDLNFKVGSLEALCCAREEPAAPRRELMLALDAMEMAELNDLRCGSGVVRFDDGVTLLRGIIDGDWAADLGVGKVIGS